MSVTRRPTRPEGPPPIPTPPYAEGVADVSTLDMDDVPQGGFIPAPGPWYPPELAKRGQRLFEPTWAAGPPECRLLRGADAYRVLETRLRYLCFVGLSRQEHRELIEAGTPTSRRLVEVLRGWEPPSTATAKEWRDLEPPSWRPDPRVEAPARSDQEAAPR